MECSNSDQVISLSSCVRGAEMLDDCASGEWLSGPVVTHHTLASPPRCSPEIGSARLSYLSAFPINNCVSPVQSGKRKTTQCLQQGKLICT